MDHHHLVQLDSLTSCRLLLALNRHSHKEMATLTKSLKLECSASHIKSIYNELQSPEHWLLQALLEALRIDD